MNGNKGWQMPQFDKHNVRFAELRADDEGLSGVVVRYGDEAKIGNLRESIAPGAFGAIKGKDIVLNLQHSREQPIGRTGGSGLELFDSDDSLIARITDNGTSAMRSAMELARSGVLRGLSVEFTVPIGGETVTRQRGAVHRNITKARLLAIGLVDTPAYPDSVIKRFNIKCALPTEWMDFV